MDRLIKKQVIMSIFSFIFISLIVIGTSNAFLRGSVQTESVEEKVGELKVSFTEGNVITLTGLDPISDADALGRSDNIYSFTINNTGNNSTGNVPYSYKISLVNNDSNVDARFIKYCLVEGNSSFDSCTPKSISSSSSFSNSEITSKSGLLAGNSISYKLKVWLAMENGTMNIPNESIGKNIKLKIYVCGQAGMSVGELTAC